MLNTALPCPGAEFWENYTGPRIMTNRYVWAAAAVVALLAAVYSSERLFVLCWSPLARVVQPYRQSCCNH